MYRYKELNSMDTQIMITVAWLYLVYITHVDFGFVYNPQFIFSQLSMFRLLSRSLQTPSFPSPCKSSLSRYFSTPKSQTRPFSSSHIRPIVYVRFSSPNSPRGQGPWGRENQLKVVAALCGVVVLYYVAQCVHINYIPNLLIYIQPRASS